METTVTRQHHARSPTLLGFVSMVLLWGSFPVATKIGTQYAPPLLLGESVTLAKAGGFVLVMLGCVLVEI